MSIYARVISVVKPISRIITNIGGTNKDITGVYTFVNGVRKQLWPSSNAKLLTTITSAGAYSYTVPVQYQYVLIEIAGAAGQSIYNTNTGSMTQDHPRAGRGAIKRYIVSLSNRTITGVIGVQPSGNSSCIYGGSGYQNGTNATISSEGLTGGYQPGGGGGSTSVVYDGTTKTAGGGSGAGFAFVIYGPTYPPADRRYYVGQGGNGGGPNGGVATTVPYTPTVPYVVPYDGIDATDATDGYNTGTGYVKVYGLY